MVNIAVQRCTAAVFGPLQSHQKAAAAGPNKDVLDE